VVEVVVVVENLLLPWKGSELLWKSIDHELPCEMELILSTCKDEGNGNVCSFGLDCRGFIWGCMNWLRIWLGNDGGSDCCFGGCCVDSCGFELSMGLWFTSFLLNSLVPSPPPPPPLVRVRVCDVLLDLEREQYFRVDIERECDRERDLDLEWPYFLFLFLFLFMLLLLLLLLYEREWVWECRLWLSLSRPLSLSLSQSTSFSLLFLLLSLSLFLSKSSSESPLLSIRLRRTLKHIRISF
jgi:hypothetical protein